ncbi:NAD-dependent malic enzyme [Tessaracoccus flavus]|uniref:Putative malate oxidoreductase [NAD] n=1 Tax=Tessaracoccus flavus TaxID=1610493 RepID=A0A1Q2CBY1_9ACTN|nr:NAD-dependent malic enzyme [Tessaracoccus flavus]AQP43611.1 NAD-dependent malic enzyme [Tessaracoccus flavus]SDY88658.1 malate dehydrogenase (oxaloacetate-decarboxylating) [Tessaracoccus flavus]
MGEQRRRYEVLPGNHGSRIKVNIRGEDILHIPRLNRGTAFTTEERKRLGLVGLLPSGVTPIDAQVHRAYQQFLEARAPMAKFRRLASLRDRNTVLFFRLLSEHIEEMMPIVYTPTIGIAIEQFSRQLTRVEGVFLSIDTPEDIEEALLAKGRHADDIDIIIVTDSEGILGIGDQGVGGIQICLGKKSLYTAAGGVDPNRMISVCLDVGTNNLGLLNDDLYPGVRHARVRGKAYDDFVDAFVTAAQKVFPHAMIHWEDFGAANAHKILDRYRDEVCTFNDDVQGTAAVVGAAATAAVRAKGERLRDQRVVVYGAGTAGIGIADLLREVMAGEGLDPDEATDRFWCLNSRGLITDASANVRDFQEPYARDSLEVADWEVDNQRRISLAEVVSHIKPTILIGTSGQPGTFSEKIVREMAAHVDQPIIMPLSNPTPLVEATPADILEWTDGRALIATGSPFDPVPRGDVEFEIAQANNALVFPGIGLGVAACRARRVTDKMIVAAAEAVASMVQMSTPGTPLLPRINDLRRVSATVAIAVAQAAAEEGVADVVLKDPVQDVFDRMWQPVYPEFILDD